MGLTEATVSANRYQRPQGNPDPLLDQKSASEYLNISERTMEKKRVLGGGPKYVKLGNRVLYRLSELEAYISAGERTSTSDLGHDHGRDHEE